MPTEADPGGSYRRLLVYADERGSAGRDYTAFGSLWLPWERRGDFMKVLRELMAAHGHGGELATLRQRGASNPPAGEPLDAFRPVIGGMNPPAGASAPLDAFRPVIGGMNPPAGASAPLDAYFLALIDEIFRRRWIAFRCVIAKGALDLELRQKVFAALISERVKALPRPGGGERELRVRLTKEARAQVSGQRLEDLYFRRIRTDLEGGPTPELTVRAARSLEGIEIVDLLLGLVLSDWEKKHIAKDRRALHLRVAENLGWADLAADTQPTEWKFNIWYLEHPETLRREQKAQRAVQLRLPMID